MTNPNDVARAHCQRCKRVTEQVRRWRQDKRNGARAQVLRCVTCGEVQPVREVMP